MYRTISIKIKPSPEQCKLLSSVYIANTNAFNACVDYGWNNGAASKRKIHNATYYSLRESTKLPADLLIQARQKACEVLKSVYQRKKKGKRVSMPISQACAVRYNYKSSKINFSERFASLSTLNGRVKVLIEKISAFHQQFIGGIFLPVIVNHKLFLFAKDVESALMLILMLRKI